jgi:hypothetical protein
VNRTLYVSQSCATHLTIHTHFEPLFEVYLITYSVFDT